ncbi:hypothetical protein BD770DRAFT_394767 [Pilaira anomala]|nr:hypothetical protein BD770DRAFT_394767 [Pilaira anomala]
MKSIERLSPSVINRIAAGEIIHHPYNAIKELIENSLDAGATHIQINLIDKTLGSFKIIDNGCGIKLDDMPLVCERHATSKLKEFKDVLHLSTFGFRGEALASISQVAKVTIVSKAKESAYGYQAVYQYGKMLAKPKLCASNYGTIITVQNLFENTPIRKKALKSSYEELQHISDIVKKYSIHNSTVQFNLKREYIVEVANTKVTSQLERIQQVYGSSISSHLKSIEYTDSNCQFKLLSSDITDSNTNGNKKKPGLFIFFVNNRLIDNNKIKKEIGQVYTTLANGFKPPFIYITLNVPPGHVDVNIHPTKNEVHLLNEEEIVDKIATVLKGILSTARPKKITRQPVPLPEKATLNYYFKSTVHNKATTPNSEETDSSDSVIGTPPSSLKDSSKKSKIADFFKDMDTEERPDGIITEERRTSIPNKSLSHEPASTISFSSAAADENKIPHRKTPAISAQAMIDSMNKRINNPKLGQSTILKPINTNRRREESNILKPSNISTDVTKKRASIHLKKLNSIAPILAEGAPVVRDVIKTAPSAVEENLQELHSIRTIKSEIQEAENKSLSKMFAKSQCIDIIDDVLVLITYKDHFYLCNYNTVSEEYFYQLVLYQLGQFGKLVLSTPISIKSCISLFIPDATQEELDIMILSILSHKELLQSYYNIGVELTSDNEDVHLSCLPLLLTDYTPSFDKLPIFLHNLATQIEWDNEIECLDAIAREISSFYCCCSKKQCNYFLHSMRDGNFSTPKYLSEKGYIIELDFPQEILE